MKPVFAYTDFRQYLADYYAQEKKEKPFFSYRYFSNKIGFKSKDFIYRVITGKKNLSKSSIMQISVALGHGKREAEYFESMVWFTQAKRHTERDLYYQQLTSITRRSRLQREPRILSHSQYRLFSDWYHLTVRSLIEMYGFPDDYDWLAKTVYPSITPAQAKHSVELLEELGLISKDGQGVYRAQEKAISTGDEIEQHALQNFYLACLKNAGASLDEAPRSERNITGLTVGISENKYKLFVERINALRKELAELADSDDEADRVYQLNFLLFPVSRKNEAQEEKPRVNP